VFPKIGEMIRFRARVPVIILDYEQSGEARRLDVPLATRGLEPRDDTGLWMEPGAVVEVLEMKIVTSPLRNKFAWARVRPAARK
jgi:hypothetical protein